MAEFRVLFPSGLAEAIKCLSEEDGTAILAGGTDILPLINYGLYKPATLVSLDKLSGLKGISFSRDEVRIGAMTTLSMLAKNERIMSGFPALSQAARLVASPQIRNTGTLGGNILQERRCKYFNRTARWRAGLETCFLAGGTYCYQAPKSAMCRALYYSDTATPLVAYRATLEIIGAGGEKTLPIEDFFALGGRLQRGEVLTSILLPRPKEGQRSVFLKESLRAALDFPVANTAVNCFPGKKDLAIAVGALAPYPLRLPETEQLLSEAGPDFDLILASVKNELAKKHSIVSEVEATASRKLEIAGGLIKKALRVLEIPPLGKE